MVQLTIGHIQKSSMHTDIIPRLYVLVYKFAMHFKMAASILISLRMVIGNSGNPRQIRLL